MIYSIPTFTFTEARLTPACAASKVASSRLGRVEPRDIFASSRRTEGRRVEPKDIFASRRRVEPKDIFASRRRVEPKDIFASRRRVEPRDIFIGGTRPGQTQPRDIFSGSAPTNLLTNPTERHFSRGCAYEFVGNRTEGHFCGGRAHLFVVRGSTKKLAQATARDTRAENAYRP